MIASLLTICSLRMSISRLASNSNSYTVTLHRYPPSTSQPHNLSALARLQIPTPNLSSDLFHLIWANISLEPRRVVRGLITERNCSSSKDKSLT